ncbi:hypothetical protein MASR1M31_12030 [Porphyromonadaceae bacterium]
MILVFVLGYTLIAFEFNPDQQDGNLSLSWCISMDSVCAWSFRFCSSNVAKHLSSFLNERPDLASASLNEQIRTFVTGFVLTNHLGDVASILFFLMGAMTIVEVIDQHGGFNFVNRKLNTRNSCKLLWMMML